MASDDSANSGRYPLPPNPVDNAQIKQEPLEELDLQDLGSPSGYALVAPGQVQPAQRVGGAGVLQIHAPEQVNANAPGPSQPYPGHVHGDGRDEIWQMNRGRVRFGPNSGAAPGPQRALVGPVRNQRVHHGQGPAASDGQPNAAVNPGRARLGQHPVHAQNVGALPPPPAIQPGYGPARPAYAMQTAAGFTGYRYPQPMGGMFGSFASMPLGQARQSQAGPFFPGIRPSPQMYANVVPQVPSQYGHAQQGHWYRMPVRAEAGYPVLVPQGLGNRPPGMPLGHAAAFPRGPPPVSSPAVHARQAVGAAAFAPQGLGSDLPAPPLGPVAALPPVLPPNPMPAVQLQQDADVAAGRPAAPAAATPAGVHAGPPTRAEDYPAAPGGNSLCSKS
ncbi:hypothetical protein AURDEDRAFT_163374 [Auricularia subglabra TFB-10046 SS5]|nr:hypothetical protein AURDEDRAFT_163374 [Auricularia subglabra TFB-10046 SS5]